MSIDPGSERPTTAGDSKERRRLDTDRVCRHLALVAIDGATDEVLDTMSPDFRLHLDGGDTDRTAYLALIEANHAAHGDRPALDVVRTVARNGFVTAFLDSSWVAHFELGPDSIEQLWMAPHWQTGERWLGRTPSS